MKKLISILGIAVCIIVLFVNVIISSSDESIFSSLRLLQLSAIADDVESNNAGNGNPFYYTHLLGDPKECSLYKNVHINGTIEYTESSVALGTEWTSTPVKGIKELCPKSGNGCQVYSCRITP